LLKFEKTTHNAGVLESASAMKASDIDRLRDAGLISGEQRNAIIEHFKLDREANKMLVILSILGGILISAGIILLIASNWQDIPRLVKIATGLCLMLGAHVGAWRLRQSRRYPVVGEALHFLGSGLFLANIALVGQIYNLSSRPPNAILLWLVGIAPLPWLLRSKAQHALVLGALGLWLGLEMNQEDSLLFFGGEARQFMFYAILGIVFWGLGMLVRRTGFAEFGPATEKFGLLMMHIAAYPLALGFYYESGTIATHAWLVAGGFTALAFVLVLLSTANESLLAHRTWRWIWAGALAGVLALAWMGLLVKANYRWDFDIHHAGADWIAIPAMFCFCLVQAQIGLLRRSPWLVNVAIAFLGAYIVTGYFELFGSMQRTGLMFVVSGVLLIALAIFLERKRRGLLQRMRAAPNITPEA
jgi:uncharacterized membrane protein